MMEMSLDEALRLADQYGERDSSVPSVSRTLAAEVRRLVSEVAAKQAVIDSLMLEFCPAEMVLEQVADWLRHRRAAG